MASYSSQYRRVARDDNLISDIKMEARKYVRHFEASMNRLDNLAQNLSSKKRELWFSLCAKCKPKAVEMLEIKENLFSDFGCQTEDENAAAKLPPQSLKILHAMTAILMENDRLKSGTNQAESFSEKYNECSTANNFRMETETTKENEILNACDSEGCSERENKTVTESDPTSSEECQGLYSLSREDMIAKIKKLNTDNRILKESQESLETACLKQQEEYESTVNEYKEKLKIAEQRYTENITDERKILEDKLSTLAKDCGCLQNNLSKAEAEVKNKDDLVASLQLKIQENESLSNALKDQIRTLQEQLNFRNEKQNDSKETEIQSQNTELLQMRREVNDMEKENKDMSAQIKILQEEKEQLQNDFDTRQRDMMKRTAEIEELKKEKTCLVQEKDGISYQLQFELHTKEELQNKLDETLKENKSFLGDISRKAEELKKTQDEKEALERSLSQEKDSVTAEKVQFSSRIDELQEHIKHIQKELRSKDRDLDDKVSLTDKLQKKNQTMQEQLIKLEEENKEMACSIIALRQDKVKLDNELGTKHEEANSIRRDKEKLSTDLQTLEEKKNSLEKDLRMEIETLKDEKALISSKVHESRQDIEKIRKELGKKHEEANSIRRDKDKLMTDLQKLEEKKDSLEKDLRTEIETLKDEKALISSKVHESRQDIEKIRKELGSKCEEIDKLSKNLETTEHEKQALRQKMDSLMQENEDMYSKVQTSRQEIEQVKRELAIKDEDIRKMKTELRNAKKKTLVMGLRSERSGMGKTMVEMITRELKRRLRGRLDRENIELTIRPCQTVSDIPNGPLVVLCLNMSRVGTNIQDALEGVKATKDVFVLVLHNTSKENLSSLTPTSLRVTSSELRQLGGIYDMAFDSGLYECDLNDSAMEKIFHILMKY